MRDDVRTTVGRGVSRRSFGRTVGAALRGAGFLAAAGGLVGCGYTTAGLYPEQIQTVAVPIIANTGLRRDVEFQLTEKVIQKIESRTPLKVVRQGDADSEVRAEISAFTKGTYAEDVFDNPLGANMFLNIKVAWVD
ncbi:MAG: hypothetical protein ACRDD1_04975, partial [Planctomycetia bacterium]